MKFESKAKKPSVQGANLNAATKGDGLPWNNMNQQCRFTSGEIRTIHMGYALVVFSIAVFAILATTVVVPALRSQSLQKTVRNLLGFDVVVEYIYILHSLCQSVSALSTSCQTSHVVYKGRAIDRLYKPTVEQGRRRLSE